MQFVLPLKVEFTCNVCKEAWDPEAATKCKDCEATFCKACFDEAMMKESKCHSCDKQPATFGNVHMLVRSMATNLKVFCRFKAHGCDWTGVRTAFPGHVDVCPKKPKEFSYVDESAIPQELMCPVCNAPFTDPVELPCEHVFCRSCITTVLNQSPLHPVCPVDRSTVTLESMSQPPKFITEILDEIPVFCAHRLASEGACAWTGRRRDYIGHRAVCKGGTSTGVLPEKKKVVIVEPTTTVNPASAGGETEKSKKMIITPMTEFPSLAAADLSQDIYALAHLTAPKLNDLSERKKPLSISAVIDVSGSMSGGKLKMAQESLQFMIDELTDRDELGIIAFHTDVDQTLSLVKMTGAGKKQARAAVEALRAQNCTNLSAGLFAGVNQLQRKPFNPHDFDCYSADGSCQGYSMPGEPRPGFSFGPPSDPMSTLFGQAPPRLPLSSAQVSVTNYGSQMTRNTTKYYQYGCEITFDQAAAMHIEKIVMVGDTNVLSSKTLEIGGLQPAHPHSSHRGPHHNPFSAMPVVVPSAAGLTGSNPKVGVAQKFSWESDRPEMSLTLTVHFKSSSGGHTPLRHTIDLSTGFKTTTIPMPGAVAPTITTPAVPPTHPVVVPSAPSLSTDSCRAVLLFTDGAANGGITKEDALKRVLQQRLEPCVDMVVHTFGFGKDHNASLMQSMAEIASGSYYYIQDVATMKESFADCLGGLLSTVAQNIQLTITPQPGFTVSKVLSSYSSKAGENGSTVVTMRDLYSAEQRDVLVCLKMTTAQPVGMSSSLVTFEVKYDSLLSGATEKVTADASSRMEEEKSREPANTQVDEQRARIEVTETLKAARIEADNGNVQGARDRMQKQREAMSRAHQPTEYFNAMMDDMTTVEKQMTSTNRWADGGSKECAQVSSCHGAQRMNRSHCIPEAQASAFGSYDNSWKKGMRDKSHQ